MRNKLTVGLNKRTVIMPWNFFIYLSSVYFIFHNESEYKWLLPFILLPILFFTFVSSFRPILPHWPMPGYIAAIVTASLWISKWKMRSIKYYFIASFLFLLILIPVAAIHSVKGILPIDKKVDVTLDGQGWNEIAAILEKDGLLNSVSFLFTNKWFTACEIHYALGNRFPVTVLNVEESNSYALWFDNKDILGKDGIFVTPDRYPFDPNELYPNNFTSIEFIGEYKTFRSGNEGQCFKVWLCKNLQNYQAHKYRNE